MLTKRIVPCLDVKEGRVVKGTCFVSLKDAGDPVELARCYEEEGADELVLLDITASVEKRQTFIDVVEQIAKNLSIPFTVGGGIRTLDDIRRLMNAGADKIAINTAALNRPELIAEAAQAFGSQALVVAIDVKRGTQGWEVFSHGGRTPTGKDAIAWAKRVQELGAGEILATSIDRDGTKQGYDLQLIQALNQVLEIPIIASGGVGCWEDIRDVFAIGQADAALAASLFHFDGCCISKLKEQLAKTQIKVRVRL